MNEKLIEELQTTLIQRVKSPFFGSFLIGLVIFNYRYILILLSTRTVEEKFKFIDTYRIQDVDVFGFGFFYIDYICATTLLYPFLLASFWLLVVPLLEYYISMPIWKWNQNRLKKKSAKFDNEKTFLASERDKYRNDISIISEEKNILRDKLVKIDLVNLANIEKAIKDKDDEFEKKEIILNKDFEISLKDKEREIQKEKKLKEDFEINLKEKEKLNNNYFAELEKKDNEIRDYKATIKEHGSSIITILGLNNENDKMIKKIEEYEEKEKKSMKLFELQKNDLLKDFSIDEIKFLETIYKKGIQDSCTYLIFIDRIQKYFSVPRMNLEKILDDLIKRGWIGDDVYEDISYTKAIKDLMYSAFSKEN